MSGLIKGILLAVLTAMMLLLVALALVSLARLDGGDSGATGDELTAPAEPLTSVPLGPTGEEGYVSCFRSGDDSTYVVRLRAPGSEPEPYTVGVALLGPDGERNGRTVAFPDPESGVDVDQAVPESEDGARYRDCTVLAIESDKRVILTGR